MDTRTTTRAVMAAFVTALLASPAFAQNPQSSPMGQQRPNEGTGSSARTPAVTGTGAAQIQTDPGANLAPAPGSASSPGGAGQAGAPTAGQRVTNESMQQRSQGGGGGTVVPNPAGLGTGDRSGSPGNTAGAGTLNQTGTGGTAGQVSGQGALTQGSGSTAPSAMGVQSGDGARMGQSSGRQGVSDGGPGTQATSDRGVGASTGGSVMQPQGAAGQSGVGPSGTNTATTGDQRGGQNTATTGVTPARDRDTQDANAPVPGANSFTEGQARGRAEARGLTEVGELTKDDNGIWRGRAMQDGRQVEVMVDFQGNVVAR